MKHYTITEEGGTLAITCHVCGRTSYHPGDVENLYCAKCKAFHNDRGRDGTPEGGTFSAVYDFLRRVSQHDREKNG